MDSVDATAAADDDYYEHDEYVHDNEYDNYGDENENLMIFIIMRNMIILMKVIMMIMMMIMQISMIMMMIVMRV